MKPGDHIATKSGTTEPGQRLKRAREAAGLSELYIAQQLRLSVDIIKAIDKDDYHFGARLIYLKGYLKSYAKLVNLPADEILAAFSQLGVPEPPAIYPEIPLSHRLPGRFSQYFNLPKWIWPTLVLIAVTAAIAWWHTHEFKRRLNIAMEAEDLHPSVHPTPVNAIDTDAHLPLGNHTATEPSVVKPVSPTVGSSPATIPVASAEAPPVKPLRVIKYLPLPARLEFTDACWVKAMDSSGQLLYMGLKQAGEHLRLKGAAPVTLTLGNAHAVQLHYDGGMMDFANYPPQQIVHMQLGQIGQQTAVG